MSTQPYQATPIESLAPYIDPRNDISTSRRVQQPTLVLEGKNFLFDSLGPKSGFAAVKVNQMGMTGCESIHSVRAGGKTFIFTEEAIMTLKESGSDGWEVLYVLGDGEKQDEGLWSPWQVIYMDDAWRFFHPKYGNLKGVVGPPGLPIQVESLWDKEPVGMLLDVRIALEVRGRAILINEKTIQWSALGDLDDFTPSLAGPGVQYVGDLVKGSVLGAAGFADNFIVWTTNGALKAEFIGGDAVWRFVTLQTKQPPLNNWCTLRLPTGQVVVLTNDGLQLMQDASQQIPWTEKFNEYLRPYMATGKPKSHNWRLAYDEDMDLLYLMESSDRKDFWRTLVLSPTLDQWGLFSRRVHGLLSWSPGNFGYVGKDNAPMVFNQGKHIEVTQPDDSMLTLHVPRIQHATQIPSSNVVCSSQGEQDSVVPTDKVQQVQVSGWYEYGAHGPSSLALGGLDSEILVGYLRPQGSSISADGFIEVQELILGTPNRRPPEPVDWTSDWKPEMYPESVDYNDGVDTEEDLNVFGEQEDWLLESGLYDWRALTGDEDWNDNTDSVFNEDFESKYCALPDVTVQMVLESSEDGITFDEQAPAIVKFNIASTQYSILSRATYHRLRLTAKETNEYFHVTYLSLTLMYGGQMG